MKILQITAGAAAMYCGSCLKDNALATELMALGHDVILLPFYTPTFTDEKNVSTHKVFFGGISVYLQQTMPLFRKLPRFFDKLWDSEFVLRVASRKSIAVGPQFLGEMTVSVLQGEQGPMAKEFEKLADWLKTEQSLAVINIPYTLLISLAPTLRRAVPKAKIVCTVQGEDLFLDGLIAPYREQSMSLIKANLQYVDRFISSSQYYKEFMAGYLGIEPSRITTVPLGIHTIDFPVTARRTSAPYKIGFFARIAPEKGLHNLCAAYRLLRQNPQAPPTTLEAAGYQLPEHHGYLEGIRKNMREWGLENEFTYHGPLDRSHKATFLSSLDVFSVPTDYHESKGLFLLEAMASGLPVVQPRHGAFPEMIDTTGGGVLVEPGNPRALAEALLAMLLDREKAQQTGVKGAAAVREYYTARRMAENTIKTYESIFN